MSRSASGSVLLIGGHVRSGTTLVRRLCNAHPDIAITHELRFFSALDQSYFAHGRFLLRDFWRRKKRNPDEARARLFLIARYLLQLRKHHNGHAGGIAVPAIEGALRALFPDRRVVGDKAPAYALQLDRLARAPDLSLSVVLRDARDVVSSTLERVRNADWSLRARTPEALAERWVRCVDLMERYRHRVHIIRYEDLVREPTGELRRLSEWLDVDPRGFQIEIVRGSSIGKYKRGLTRDELGVVMQIAGPAMERQGYR